jgi:hypothetical protein
MKLRNLKISIVILLAIKLTELHAQESFNVAGGDASGSCGAISYSIGQLVYNIHTGINGSIAEGVQQPIEISIVTATENTEDVNLFISIYPNPSTDYLILEINDTQREGLDFQLYDANGKILLNSKIKGNQTNICMGNYIPATYFLKLVEGQKILKTFKIIKK